MGEVLYRKPLTDLVLATLRAENFPIGDVTPPELPSSGLHAGWNGPPGAPGSTYQPYGVLLPLSASVSSGPISDPQADIQVPYQLSSYGISRNQVEMLADRLRFALTALRNQRVTLNGHDTKIQQVWFSVVGGIGRADQTDPATMGEVDVFNLWMTR